MTVEGIDISHWQPATPPLGTSLGFVFVRATYGTSADYRYAQHAKNVLEAGKILGAYHFGRNGSSDAQVSAFLNVIGPHVKLVALDLERDGDNPRMTDDQARRFITLVQATGRHVGLYHSQSAFPHVGQNWNWVASWDQEPTSTYAFWQYAVTRGVDRDRFNGTLDQLKRLAGLPVPVPSYQWQAKPPMFVLYDDVDAAAKTWTHRKRVLTAGTQAYRCTAPAIFHYAGSGDHHAEKLVRLGVLASGAAGPRTGKWVSADNAYQVVA